MESNGGSLQKKLLPRHISMMAMGGAIGTGIFKGSAETYIVSRARSHIHLYFCRIVIASSHGCYSGNGNCLSKYEYERLRSESIR